MLLRKNPKKHHTTPPQLPEIVYGYSPIRFALALLLISSGFAISLFVKDINIIIGLVVFIAVFVAIIGVLYFGTSKIYLTKTNAEITFGINKNKETYDLKNYNILVEISPHGDINYAYFIFLKRRDLVTSDVLKKNGAMHISIGMFLFSLIGRFLVEKYGLIPISGEIASPENAKEYIETIRTQTKAPMDLIFGSEQAKHDYISGKYKAKSL